MTVAGGIAMLEHVGEVDSRQSVGRQFHFVRRIGTGGFGEVYLAEMLSYGDLRKRVNELDSAGHAPLHLAARVETAASLGALSALLRAGASENQAGATVERVKKARELDRGVLWAL